MEQPLFDLARLAGIATSYQDVTGQARETSPEAALALLSAMGYAVDGAGEVRDSLHRAEARKAARRHPEWLICEAGTSPELRPALWTLRLEDGTEIEGADALPALPMGRHALRTGAETVWLLAAPACLSVPDRGWGVNLPLYGLRGPRRGGLGTYADLAEAATGLASHGAGFVGINPVHGGFGAAPALASPYSPSHRRMLSTSYLAAKDESGGSRGLIDYPQDLARRRAALCRAFAGFRDTDGAFAAFRRSRGAALERFALYEALAETHGPHWPDWPDELRDPARAARTADRPDLAGRVSFHAWLQFQADRQLGAAASAAVAGGMVQGLYLDLAVGTHPAGAETWDDRVSFAQGVSLGAPPDAFSEDGQNWALAPFNPRSLVENGFEAFAATLAAQLRHAGMLRIDHVLGFDRTFWVPDGAPGAYVSMPRDALLAVTRIEAARAGAAIVGEDLGNIPEGLDAALAASGLLGCTVAQFEPGAGGRGARDLALASFGTHDLPTWLGWRAGADLQARADAGTMTEAELDAARAARARDVAVFDDALGGRADLDAMHRALGEGASRLVALQIEDILEVRDQPNLPGTVDEYPNWRRRLPVDARDLGDDPRLARAAAIMRTTGR